jgi:phospholipase C
MMRPSRLVRLIAVIGARLAVAAVAATVLAVSGAAPASTAISADAQPIVAPSAEHAVGIHKIRHVVIIMQENRSFDSYLGTFPGGLPG